MSQEKILIVDGDVAFSEMLKTRLEAMGFLVDYASRGVTALEILKDEWVDLIVMAIVLKGGMNGFRLFKEIKKKKAYAKIPVIIQSSKSAMKKMFKSMGADHFFIKPYSPELFLEEAKDILTKKILVVGEKEGPRAGIIKILNRYGMRVDVAGSAGKFYADITLYRYNLVVIEDRIGPDPADKLVGILRESSKNRKSPAIVYKTHELIKGAPAEREVFGTQMFKKRCEKFDSCVFMDKGYSASAFSKLAKKYLERA